MSGEREMAVILRNVQWLADDLAHKLPTGTVNTDEREKFAQRFQAVADILRGTNPSTVVDADGQAAQ
ncbi:MAG: hypothetical protein ACRDRL_00165 [Sciscionella sp.]